MQPGPGTYDVKSGFKTAEAVQRNPSIGASSAFRSKSIRLLTIEGKPPEHPDATPGSGTYSPHEHGSIAAIAEKAARRGLRLAGLRRSSSASPRRGRASEESRPPESPGPGAYEPLKHLEQERKRDARTRSSMLASGTRRSLPWGGRGADAPRSAKTRKDPDDEEGTPGPGEYAKTMKPGAAVGATKRGSIFGRTSSPRFPLEHQEDLRL